MSKPFLKGAAFGALIASVATLFFAPQSGKKTHKDVKKLVDSLSTQLLKQSKNLKKMSKGAYDDMVNTSVKEFGKGSKLGKEYLTDVAAALMDRWDDFKKDLEMEEIQPKKAVASKTTKKVAKKKTTKR